MSNSNDATLGNGAGPVSDAPAEVDKSRRNILMATCAAGGAATAATVWPFIASLEPSERAKAAGAPVEADLSKLEPGQMQVVEWRGKPVWILHRTPEMLASLEKVDQLADPKSEKPNQPDYAQNEVRSIKPEYLVVVGICTHLGCSPTMTQQMTGNTGGFLCPCHGSMFDYAGRVYANMPAPDNLIVPPYQYVSETTVLIGDDSKGA